MKLIILILSILILTSCERKISKEDTPATPVVEKITRADLPKYSNIDFTAENLTQLPPDRELTGENLKILELPSNKELDFYPKETWGAVKFFMIKGNIVVKPHPSISILYSLDKDGKFAKTATCAPDTSATNAEAAKFIKANGCKI